jgi:hypothetical protein
MASDLKGQAKMTEQKVTGWQENRYAPGAFLYPFLQINPSLAILQRNLKA